ncbi:hypothetical protein [Fundidesulfovibrio agrisoli]|uniref:hypothetical protein n=1 Tax=Fundidesulfovibrio agrisoli TaxID=2922717 RepID=UPI001FAC9440|nr:hypothetical protein [Fundidesulfovibrio agrisoli]
MSALPAKKRPVVVNGSFGTRVRPDSDGQGKRDGKLIPFGAAGRTKAAPGYYQVRGNGPQAA